MRLLSIFMILMFLFIGMLGFGSINELETVDTMDALMTNAIPGGAIHLLGLVAPCEAVDLELNDAQITVTTPRFEQELTCIVKSLPCILNDVNAHLTSGVLVIVTRCPHCWMWPGVHQRAVLLGPYGGLVVC